MPRRYVTPGDGQNTMWPACCGSWDSASHRYIAHGLSWWPTPRAMNRFIRMETPTVTLRQACGWGTRLYQC